MQEILLSDHLKKKKTQLFILVNKKIFFKKIYHQSP